MRPSTVDFRNEPEGGSQASRLHDIFDMPPVGAIDRITALAARRVGTPVALISLVEDDRVWFASRHGVAFDEISRDPGLCVSAMQAAGPYVLTNASLDPRSATHPLVTGDFGLRFYAGVPLRSSDGVNLGVLCVIDTAPRGIEQEQLDDLVQFAALVVDQIELRLASRHAMARAKLMAREIDHRVMNSLQFVSTLLTIQSRAPNLDRAAAPLLQAANRVAAIAQMHRHFVGDDVASACCVSFLRRLCADLAAVLGREIVVHGQEDTATSAWIQPVGLLVNELVTNAAKHGAGRIDVTFEAQDGGYSLSVSDQGGGLPQDFDPASAGNGLGMQVVLALTHQLNGVLAARATQDGGACFRIAFPAVQDDRSEAQHDTTF